MGPLPDMSTIMGHMRKGSRGGRDSLDMSMASLERRLTEQTNLIDEMKKVLPMTVAAPGIIAIGGEGAGKSTVLEAITSVPLARGTGGMRRPVKMRIVADPTCTKCVGTGVVWCGVDGGGGGGACVCVYVLGLAWLARLLLSHTPPLALLFPNNPNNKHREYALISGSDPSFKDDTRRIESLDPELPRMLAALAGEGDLTDFIHVRVVRPSGPTYSVIDFPGTYVCLHAAAATTMDNRLGD